MFKISKNTIVSLFLFFIGLLLIFPLHLLPCLLSGLLVFELVNAITPLLQKFIPVNKARFFSVVLLGTSIVTILSIFFFTVISLILHEIKNPEKVIQRFMLIFDKARHQLPPCIVIYLPESADEVRQIINEWVYMHINEIQSFGRGALHIFFTLLGGMILGAIIALQNIPDRKSITPFTNALLQRSIIFSKAFHNVVFAQLKISLVNTILSAIFLLLFVPLFNVYLPLTKTLILITFIMGLIPLIGNIISNLLIFIVSLSVSIWTAVIILTYLIAIHKLEYFLNARIIGMRINSNAWELLFAMLFFDAAFGFSGLIAAPMYYAYLKSELKNEKLI
ncbi:putative permease [Candidatus Portiera aleyrodidarum]|uniref:AI-2E family transporter n=1 Tax=Candidatus Portiera aleyrodidarum TaxID=91844 RepID=UPI0005D8E1BE|nr:AI-2E family transporter [Candidatus Portiera aleyrodidarum]CEL12533.1 putative permease [Candidatus Portiera aleyrodidarum]